MTAPTLSAIHVHPIKALEPVARDRAGVSDIGGLDGDREYAIVDADGEYVNGKRTAAVHDLHTEFDLDAGTVAIGVRGEESREFHLDRDRGALESWLGEFFGYPVELRHASGGRYTDGSVYGDGLRPGPTVISRATLREAASWFDGIDPEGMCLRLRPNLVVEGVPAFWEDRLVADGGRRFRIGDATLEGIEPVPRCVVPSRDPHTGEEYDGFRDTFVRRREETLPGWVDRDAFDHFFAMMVAVGIPAGEDEELRVGDELRIEGVPGEAGGG